MKTFDVFLMRDILKVFRKAEIGFVIDDIQAYNRVLPSVRMRCYDMILEMERLGVKAELYKPFKKYSAVIFTKTRKDSAVRLAEHLRKQATLVISDNYCEYLTDETKTDDWERNNILRILSCSDFAITYSVEQQKQFSVYHDKVFFINEGVQRVYFSKQKKYVEHPKVTLIYSGYSHNAKYIEIIHDVIAKLQEQYGCRLLLLCEKDPKLHNLTYEYIHYEQKKVVDQLLLGDIMIAPRPMKEIEKMQHTLSKIASPMAVGLPVVASPVPAYKDSPAILCSTEEEWYNALENLIKNISEREEIGTKSREYVKKNLTTEIIAERYLQLIQTYRQV